MPHFINFLFVFKAFFFCNDRKSTRVVMKAVAKVLVKLYIRVERQEANMFSFMSIHVMSMCFLFALSVEWYCFSFSFSRSLDISRIFFTMEWVGVDTIIFVMRFLYRITKNEVRLPWLMGTFFRLLPPHSLRRIIFLKITPSVFNDIETGGLPKGHEGTSRDWTIYDWCNQVIEKLTRVNSIGLLVQRNI